MYIFVSKNTCVVMCVYILNVVERLGTVSQTYLKMHCQLSTSINYPAHGSQEQLRTQVPVALGQALQVPPADVLGEVLLGSMAMSVCRQLMHQGSPLIITAHNIPV